MPPQEGLERAEQGEQPAITENLGSALVPAAHLLHTRFFRSLGGL